MSKPTHALFAWTAHDAQGGINDLRVTGSIEECRRFVDSLDIKDRSRPDYAEIVDLETLKAVLEARVVYEPSPITNGPSELRWEWREPNVEKD